MNNFWFVVIVSTISGVLGTALGGVLGTIFKKDNSKIVSLLLSFAGGVMPDRLHHLGIFPKDPLCH